MCMQFHPNSTIQFLKAYNILTALKSDVVEMLTVEVDALNKANAFVNMSLSGVGYGIGLLDPAAKLENVKSAIQLLDTDPEGDESPGKKAPLQYTNLDELEVNPVLGRVGQAKAAEVASEAGSAGAAEAESAATAC
jgi:hypothetical protein